MSGDNTSPSPWMSRVTRGRPRKEAVTVQQPDGEDEAPVERVVGVKLPYLRFLDPAHQRVKTPK